MTGRMEYLIGSRPQLESVWRDWNILAKGATDATSPDVVEHSALIYGISASGKITTLYSPTSAGADRPRRADPGVGVGAAIRRGLRIGLVTVAVIAGVVVLVLLSGTSNRFEAGRPAPDLPAGSSWGRR